MKRKRVLKRWTRTVLLGLIRLFAWRIFAWTDRWLVEIDMSAAADSEVYLMGDRVDGDYSKVNLLVVPEPLSLFRNVEFGRITIDLHVFRAGQKWKFAIPWTGDLKRLKVVQGVQGMEVIDQSGKVWRPVGQG